MQVSSSIARHVARGDAADRRAHQCRRAALPYVRRSSSRSGAPNSARIPGGRIGASFTSNSSPTRPSTRRRPQERAARDPASTIPGIQSEVVTFLGDRISESLSGETAQVAIKVFGDDLDALTTPATKIVGALARVKGIVDLEFRRQSGTPTLDITLRPERAGRLGLRARTCSTRSAPPMRAPGSAQTLRGTRTVESCVLLPEATAQRPEAVGQPDDRNAAGPGAARAGRERRADAGSRTASSTTADSGASA